MALRVMQDLTLDPAYNDKTLGSIVHNCFVFIHSGFQGIVLDDLINKKSVASDSYFVKWRNGYLVKREFLPFDFDIKAVYIKGKNVFIETEEIDFAHLKEVLSGDGEVVRIVSGNFYSDDAETKGAIIKTEKIYIKKTHSVRSKIMIMSKAYFSQAQSSILKVINAIFEYTCFKEKLSVEVAARRVGQGKQSGELRQDLDVDLLLEAVQKPSADLYLAPAGYLATATNILEASTEELMQLIDSSELADIGDAGLKAFHSLIRRKAIARIKNVHPGLSWGQARSLYFRLVSKP